MSELFNHINELADNAKEYINTKVEIARLTAAEKISSLTSGIIARIIVAIIFALFLLFFGMAAGFALGEWLGKVYWGFLMVAGIYLVAAITVWAIREKLIRLPIMNAIIHELFKENEHHEKDQEY